MYKKYNINLRKAKEIIDIKNKMVKDLFFCKEIFIILYESPEGSPRPRARLVPNKNLINNALKYPNLIQIYSPVGNADKIYMKRLLSEEELLELESLIYTPCIVNYDAYFHTPNAFSAIDKFLAELGYIRPITKPDFDNIEKKYSDMYTDNIWIDDSLVISSTFNKYYSILPRMEITLRYMNKLYTKYQYKSIKARLKEGDEIDYFKRDD